MAVDAERRYITSSNASVASVVACSTPRAAPPGSRELRDRRFGLAAGRGRGVADTEQRDVKLLARRLPGRKPLHRAAEQYRSLGATTGEEEHPAQLDRRRTDRDRVLAAIDDLRQRRDRLRCAGARMRLAKLEHDGVAVVVAGRLVERAGE